ncbi:hypothetical protein Glove_639g5 [Diversispora epigaea]|uniref:Uncharacterized protein n=1 Tax=Diversispora epigaea TaxID=1348612 RepID=A0A397G4P7_9GLOM|nr:hypothetical protein Glove_639g5 [Diversispora epigaea]
MWIGTTPQCLQGLTIPEQLLISTSYICINLIQLNNRRYTHHKLKGHIITFTQEPTSLFKILPLLVYQLCDHLKNKIATALEWLMNHNILYKNINIDRAALDSLPENGVSTALLTTTVMVNINPKKIEHYTGYTTQSIDEYNINDDLDNVSDEEISNERNMSGLHDSITELRNSGVTYTDSISVSEQECTLKLLEKMIQESTDNKQTCSHTILMPHSNVPRNEYTDLTLLPATFSTLFPYGVGGHEDNFRKYHIPFKQYIKHLLQVRDSKFKHHRSFIFATFDILRRRKIVLGTYLIAKQTNFKQSAKLISKLTPNDIKIAIEQIHDNQPITNRSIFELTKNINVVGGKIMGSHQLRNLLRYEIRAVIIRDGKEINVNTLLPENFPTATKKAKLAHLDPTAIVKYFNVVIEKIIKFIIGYKKPEGGVFGKIKNYYAITEYQDREDISYLFPNNEDFLTDEMLDIEYKTPKTNLEKKVHPSILPIPDPQSPYFNEEFRLDILKIAKLEIPGKIYPELGIITLQCRNAYINNHNPYITASCHGNNDIRFIATVKLALAYIHYITNYITKSDASTHNSFLMCAMTLNKFVTEVSDLNELSKEFIPRSRKLVTMCLNKIVGQTEMTGPQVSAYLLGIKDHYTPNKFVSIYLNSFETYLTSQYPIENLSEAIFSDNSDTDSDEDELDQEDNNNHDSIDNEMFTIINSSKQINAVNLRIDYMYHGKQLENMCLYDYISVIHKIKINEKELDKLNRQKNRERYTTRVDRFLFLDGEKKCDENCNHDFMVLNASKGSSLFIEFQYTSQ